MTFIAAMLRRYPYADSPRVGQHLVGPICLLIGVGSAAIIRRFARSERAVRRAGVTVFIVLIVIGLIAPAVLIIAPSREMQRDFTVRRFVRAAMTGILPQTTVAVVERPDYSDILRAGMCMKARTGLSGAFRSLGFQSDGWAIIDCFLADRFDGIGRPN